MRLKDLPKEVRDRIIVHSKYQGRDSGDYAGSSATVNGAFRWDSTKEGQDFWQLVSKGELRKYYERYPEDKILTEEEIEEKRIKDLLMEEEKKKQEEDLYKFLNS